LDAEGEIRDYRDERDKWYGGDNCPAQPDLAGRYDLMAIQRHRADPQLRGPTRRLSGF
jgi:hypothetical protein